MQFNDSHKEEVQFGNYFDYGVHKVKILGFRADKTDKGAEFIEVGFTNMDGDIEDSARVWFTTDEAAKYSFNTLRSIALHNTMEEKREAAKKTIDAATDHEKLANILEQRLIGGEMWFTKYTDPKRSYIDQRGVSRQSVNKNIYGYEPKPNLALIPRKESTGQAAAAVFPDATDEPFPSTNAPKGEGEGWA